MTPLPAAAAPLPLRAGEAGPRWAKRSRCSAVRQLPCPHQGPALQQDRDSLRPAAKTHAALDLKRVAPASGAQVYTQRSSAPACARTQPRYAVERLPLLSRRAKQSACAKPCQATHLPTATEDPLPFKTVYLSTNSHNASTLAACTGDDATQAVLPDLSLRF